MKNGWEFVKECIRSNPILIDGFTAAWAMLLFYLLLRAMRG